MRVKEIGRGRPEGATYNRKKSEQKWAEEWRKEAQSGDRKTISGGKSRSASLVGGWFTNVGNWAV